MFAWRFDLPVLEGELYMHDEHCERGHRLRGNHELSELASTASTLLHAGHNPGQLSVLFVLSKRAKLLRMLSMAAIPAWTLRHVLQE